MRSFWKKILLFITFIFTLPVFASDKTVFAVQGIEAAPGSKVTVLVNMRNNPKFELLSFSIPIDTTKVDFLGCEINGFDKAMMKDCSLNPKNEIIFYALTMYTEDKKLLSDTGDIARIYLKIKDNAKKDIPLSLNITDYGKSESEPLKYDVVNGMIKIRGNIETRYVDSSISLRNQIKNLSEEKITWKSSNKAVAKVDKEGHVTFVGTGNATITATDSKGRIIYEKTYLVSEDIKEGKSPVLMIVIIVVVLLLIVGGLFIRKKKGKKHGKA